MHRLQPVAQVGDRPADDHAHGVVEIGGLHLRLDRHRRAGMRHARRLGRVVAAAFGRSSSGVSLTGRNRSCSGRQASDSVILAGTGKGNRNRPERGVDAARSRRFSRLRQPPRPDGGAGDGAGDDPDREGPGRPGRARRASSSSTRRRSGRATARGWWRGPGAIRRSPTGCARDATAAIASLGYGGRQGEHMRAVFNTPGEHNLIVCTLCSCYPIVGARPAAGLVQGAALPLARGHRPARRARRVRPDARSRRRRSGSGIRPPSCATWWCRCAPRAARGWTRRRWPTSSPATR